MGKRKKFLLWLSKIHSPCGFHKHEGAFLIVLITEKGSRISELLACYDTMKTGGNLHSLYCFEWSHTMKKMPGASLLEHTVKHSSSLFCHNPVGFLVCLFFVCLFLWWAPFFFTLFQTHGILTDLRISFQSRH